MKYTNYTNLDSRFSRVYEPGDRLVKGWEGEVEHDGATTLTIDSLNLLYERHNRDDRPDGQLCPSMSIGDVVVLGETAWSVNTFGFTRVDLRFEDLITDRTWREIIAEASS